MTKQIGIKILYSTVTEGFEGLKAIFVVTEGNPSPTFVTNPAIRKAIALSGFNRGHTMGHMSVTIHPLSDTANWTYYPFGSSTTEPPLGSRFGIAQLLERFVTQEFQKRFPQIKKFRHEKIQNPRAIQLKKRGLSEKELAEGYPIEHGLRLLSKKIASDHKNTLANAENKPGI